MTLWPKCTPVKDQQRNYELFHKYFYETHNFPRGQLQSYPTTFLPFEKVLLPLLCQELEPL